MNQMRMRCLFTIVVAAASAALAGGARATVANDPINDFIPTYTGPHGGDLDVVSSDVMYNTATDMFTFTGTMNAAIGTTPGSIYVWGVNRGTGTAAFATLGAGYPNILFDTVVILRPGGTSAAAGVSLPAADVSISGNTISATFSGSLLPSTGFAKADYTWNLWPRSSGNSISDFAPDASNMSVTAVPEPATLLLMGLGLGALALRRSVRRPG